jgi:hypothetical protein
MRVVVGVGISAALTLASLGTAVGASGGSGPLAPPSAATVGNVAIVQAVPGETVDVTIDGKAVESGVDAAEVLGPYELSAGTHQVDFSGDGIEQATIVEVAAGSNQDVVLHLPASVGGDALVTTYPAPVKPIGPGKARVLVAHTANVAPADIQVDGQVVFTNVANGEFATADLPAGEHVVALFPTGETSDPILGPLTVDLAARSLTMVYAVGNPETDSMDLVAHTAELAADGTLVPRMINTGSAGLAADVRVVAFGRSSS